MRPEEQSAPTNGVEPEPDSHLARVVLDQKVAGGLGFEPRLTAPKTVVLPLDDPPVWDQNYTAEIEFLLCLIGCYA